MFLNLIDKIKLLIDKILFYFLLYIYFNVLL